MKINEIKNPGEPEYYIIRRPLAEAKRPKAAEHLSIPHLHHTDPRHDIMSKKLQQLQQDDPTLYHKVLNWD